MEYLGATYGKTKAESDTPVDKRSSVFLPLFGSNKVQKLRSQRGSPKPMKSKLAKRVLAFFFFLGFPKFIIIIIIIEKLMHYVSIF